MGQGANTALDVRGGRDPTLRRMALDAARRRGEGGIEGDRVPHQLELTTWNYGTLDQRLALGHWATIGDRIRELLLGGWIWVPLLLVLLWQARKLGFWLGWLLTIVLPIAVFFNLFWIHDYYLAAISPAIAGRSVSESTSCTPTSASGGGGRGCDRAARVVDSGDVEADPYVQAVYEKNWDPAQIMPCAEDWPRNPLPATGCSSTGATGIRLSCTARTAKG